MPKDYPASNPYHAPLRTERGVYGDLRDQFTAPGNMHANDAPTLIRALHARTRELDAALAKIAILEYTVKVYETEPLRLAYDKLEATGASLVFVGEIRAGETPRIRESGELLAVLETLAARWAMFGTQVVELNVNEKLAS
jgi:hypothetical protein